jgi:hypothetical protein
MNRFLWLVLSVLVGACAVAPNASQLERHELAPDGVLRVAVYTGNPLIGSPNPGYGEPRGPTALLGKELAMQAGVLSRLVEYTAEAKMLEDARAGAWDVAGLACDPARRAGLELTPPLLIVGERIKPATEICLVLPPGRSAARNYAAGFVARAKSQGMVALAIEQSALRGARVAP